MSILDWFQKLFATSSPVPVVVPGGASPQPFAISANGISFLKQRENLRLKAYRDSGGLPTIGYGTIIIEGKPVTMGMVITEAQAETALRSDLRKYVDAVARHVTRQPMYQNQIDALVSFTYNVGVEAFVGSSLLRIINVGELVTRDLFTRWNKVRDRATNILTVVDGLTNRRNLEYELYIS